MDLPSSSVYGTSRNVHRDLYPDIEPFDVGFLKVSELHELYYEQSGNKNGKPVVYVHGGPGSGTDRRDRRFFDPEVYRIILFDQRGAGQSKPSAELEENTTWDLVEDMEKLRKHLSVDKWVVFGGSWGSTLSLVYAQSHPDNVVALVTQGIFTLRRFPSVKGERELQKKYASLTQSHESVRDLEEPMNIGSVESLLQKFADDERSQWGLLCLAMSKGREILWFYQDGASHIFPDAFESFTELIPQAERYDLLSAYHRRLTDADPKVQLVYARRWNLWELTTLRLLVDPDVLKRVDSDLWSLQHARIEA